MRPQSTAPETRLPLPPCRNCEAPMRIRTIEVMDRQEEIKLVCTGCGSETIQSYKLGN